MKIAKIILAATTALSIIGSAALAQQVLTGTVTKVDWISGTIAIQQAQSGTIGANTVGAAEEFKAQHGLPLDDVHAGDKGYLLRYGNGWDQDNHETSETVNQKPKF